MKETISIFLFVGSNHLSNVHSLQSIYKQDYKHIRLIVCNDCTYGFESARLLENFEHDRPKNIEHIIFQENRTPIGEYRSLLKYWHQTESAYFMILHAGEYFVSPSSLREAVQNFKRLRNADAILCGCECWDDNFENVLKQHTSEKVMEEISGRNSRMHFDNTMRDCMVIYKTDVLPQCLLSIEENVSHISCRLVPWLIKNKFQVKFSNKTLCRYSESSILDMVRATPDTFERRHLANIIHLLQKQGIHMSAENAEVTVVS